MDLIAQIPLIGPIAAYALPFFFVLGVVVFVHEYGHYIVARWCGVHSDAFSIGFGPEILGWEDSRGTRWKISLIPLGGYVKFRGDADAASARTDNAALEGLSDAERAGAFPTAALWRRASIVSAGPLANFILSALLIAGIAMVSGVASDKPVIGFVESGTEGGDAGFEPGDRIATLDGAPVTSFSDFFRTVALAPGQEFEVGIERDGQSEVLPFNYDPPVILERVTTGSAADDAGLEVGDEIVGIAGKPLTKFEELQVAVREAEGSAIALAVRRGEETIDVSLTPRRTEIRDSEGEIIDRWLIGVSPRTLFGLGAEAERLGPVAALEHGVKRTGDIITGTLFFLYELIAGRGDSGDLGGPLRIAEFSGDAAAQGFEALIGLTALLSASIGLINLFPIPVLDGGHLLFYAIEALRGKPLNDKVQEIGLTIGFALVIMLMVYATYNDVMRL